MNIHPSVLLNISEHYTRSKENNSLEPVIGALLGKNDLVVDTFEIIADQEFYDRKLDLVRQVSPELEVIGWYSATNHWTPTIGGLGKIYIRLDPDRRDGNLPISVFMLIDGNLVGIDWKLVTDDAETVGLEHAKGAESRLHPEQAALKKLKQGIQLISRFVKDVNTGALPVMNETNSIIIEIVELTQKYSNSQKQYHDILKVKSNDVALQTYLGIILKGCDAINKRK